MLQNVNWIPYSFFSRIGKKEGTSSGPTNFGTQNTPPLLISLDFPFILSTDSLITHHTIHEMRSCVFGMKCLKYCHDDDQGREWERGREKEGKEIHATSSNCLFLELCWEWLFWDRETWFSSSIFLLVMVVRGEVIICSASQGLPSIAERRTFHSISLFLFPSLS